MQVLQKFHPPYRVQVHPLFGIVFHHKNKILPGAPISARLLRCNATRLVGCGSS